MNKASHHESEDQLNAMSDLENISKDSGSEFMIDDDVFEAHEEFLAQANSAPHDELDQGDIDGNSNDLSLSSAFEEIMNIQPHDGQAEENNGQNEELTVEQGPNGPIELDVQDESEELSASKAREQKGNTEKVKHPWYLNTFIILGGVFGFLALIGMGLYLAFSASSNSTSTTPIVKQEPVQATNIEALPATDGSGITNDKLFNGLDATTKQSAVDYTDSDPITKQTIASLELKLKSAQKQVATATRQVGALQSEKNVLEREKASLTELRSKAMQKLSAAQSDIKFLNDELTQKKSDIQVLTEKNNELIIAVASEKRLLSSEKEARLTAEKRYVALVASRSQELIDMTEAVDNLSARVESTFAEKNQREAEQMLSQLQLVMVDPATSVGKFLVMRNGKPIKDITLESGETLVGRGMVESVDDYGCITFTDGHQYEPLNGYCP